MSAFTKVLRACIEYREMVDRLEAENAELREANDAFFKHNNILVKLMTEEQKKKALDILIKPKEAQQ